MVKKISYVIKPLFCVINTMNWHQTPVSTRNWRPRESGLQVVSDPHTNTKIGLAVNVLMGNINLGMYYRTIILIKIWKTDSYHSIEKKANKYKFFYTIEIRCHSKCIFVWCFRSQSLKISTVSNPFLIVTISFGHFTRIAPVMCNLPLLIVITLYYYKYIIQSMRAYHHSFFQIKPAYDECIFV